MATMSSDPLPQQFTHSRIPLVVQCMGQNSEASVVQPRKAAFEHSMVLLKRSLF